MHWNAKQFSGPQDASYHQNHEKCLAGDWFWSLAAETEVFEVPQSPLFMLDAMKVGFSTSYLKVRGEEQRAT